MQVMVTVGALLAYCLGWPYAKEHDSYISIGTLHLDWWRIMLGLGLVPAIIQVNKRATGSSRSLRSLFCLRHSF